MMRVIEAHERRCAISKLQEALSHINMGRASAQEEALEMVLYDQHLRRLLEDRQGIVPENQAFLFGRPLKDLIPSFGFRFERKADGHIGLAPFVGREGPPA